MGASGWAVCNRTVACVTAASSQASLQLIRRWPQSSGSVPAALQLQRPDRPDAITFSRVLQNTPRSLGPLCCGVVDMRRTDCDALTAVQDASPSGSGAPAELQSAVCSKPTHLPAFGSSAAAGGARR